MVVLKRIISLLGLELNTDKSRITTAENGFDFLGYHFVRKWNSLRNKQITYNYPSVKAINNLREGIKQKLQKRTAHHIPLEYVIKGDSMILSGDGTFTSGTQTPHRYSRDSRNISNGNWQNITAGYIRYGEYHQETIYFPQSRN